MSDSPTGNPSRITSTMHRVDDTHGSLRVSSRFSTTPDDLWDAITNPVRLARWIARVEGELRVGGKIHATYTSGWEGDSIIEQCQAPETLVISTTEDDGSVARLTAQIAGDGDGAILTIEDSGLTLPELHFHTAGWGIHLEDLIGLLERDENSTNWRERWEAALPEAAARPIL
jgi:uncharacterized protein YndB with AHSA1/START domain